MRLANGLLTLSAVVFAAIGIAYLLAPGAMLAIVGVESGASADFLLRTEGVALLAGAGLILAVMRSGGRSIRIGLLSLAGYYVLGSLVDLAAFVNGVVGPASVPSIAVRLGLGGLCVLAASAYPAAESSS